MSAPLLAKEEVSQRIFGVFRTYGYEGATLARISVATGLGRASLYHYYPGGKDDMAREVLGTARGWLESNVVAALERPGGHAARLRAMTARRRRRISSSLFPENMGPQIASIQPVLGTTSSKLRRSPVYG